MDCPHIPQFEPKVRCTTQGARFCETTVLTCTCMCLTTSLLRGGGGETWGHAMENVLSHPQDLCVYIPGKNCFVMENILGCTCILILCIQLSHTCMLHLMYVVVSVPLDVRVDNGYHLPSLGCQLVLHLNGVGELGSVPGKVPNRKRTTQSLSDLSTLSLFLSLSVSLFVTFFHQCAQYPTTEHHKECHAHRIHCQHCIHMCACVCVCRHEYTCTCMLHFKQNSLLHILFIIVVPPALVVGQREQLQIEI